MRKWRTKEHFIKLVNVVAEVKPINAEINKLDILKVKFAVSDNNGVYLF